MTPYIERKIAMSMVRLDSRVPLPVAALPVTLAWYSAEPLAVHLLFPTNQWIIGRDFLDYAAHQSAGRLIGDGDVRVGCLDDGLLTIILSSPHGVARLTCDRQPVVAFLNASWELCPSHWEYPDRVVNQAIEDLLCASELAGDEDDD